jgi:hypothetical protein
MRLAVRSTVRQTLVGSHNEQRLDNSKTIDVYAIIEGCSNVPQVCYVLRLLAVLESTDRGAVNRYKRSPPLWLTPGPHQKNPNQS